jgi:hypothetical protein
MIPPMNEIPDIDCDRTPGSETSIPEISELAPVSGNMGLSEGRKAARVRHPGALPGLGQHFSSFLAVELIETGTAQNGGTA